MSLYNAPQKIIVATVHSNDVRKDHIVALIMVRLKGDGDALVGVYGLPGKYSALADIIAKLKEKNVKILIYSDGHDVKVFNGVEVTNEFPRFIVDSSVILSEQELPVEFKHLDKVYLK